MEKVRTQLELLFEILNLNPFSIFSPPLFNSTRLVGTGDF